MKIKEKDSDSLFNKPLNKTVIIVFLSLCTGLLMGISATPSSWFYLSFIALIPLLFASDHALLFKRPVLAFTIQLLIALVVFYLIGYYWVLTTANLGFLVAFIIVLPFIILLPLYIIIKKKNNVVAAIYFIAAWLSVELIQSYFQLGSPFYNLGNNLGAEPKIIQWYEYTGASGGTLWILIVNFLIYFLIKGFIRSKKQDIKKNIVLLAFCTLPVLFSFSRYNNYKEKGHPTEVLVIHPSTDNHDVKYRVNIYELMDIYLDIMLPEITKNTEYVVLPETALTNTGWVKDFNRNLVFNYFHEHTDSFPDLKLITGAISYEAIPNVEKIRNYKNIPGIRYSKKYKTWYYTYNAALHLEKNKPVQMRVKEGLVPFQEYAPYPKLIPRLTPVGIDFQFSTKKRNRAVFTTSNNTKTAAIICYEVVFSRILSKAAQQGAQAFFVILNEGWYSNLNVSKHFIQHSVIRAIENRRSIAHSSNMGISAIINQKGEIIAQTNSKSADFLKNNILLNRKVTLAARGSNYIEIIALFVFTSIFIYQLSQILKKQLSKRKEYKDKTY